MFIQSAAPLWFILLASGCSIYAENLRNVREEFYAGRPEQARTTAAKRVEKGGRTQNVFRLNQAMIELSLGDPRSSEKLLRTVRDEFDHLEQKSVAEAAASAFTDDNMYSYAGEDYEKIFIRCFLAISNLMADGGDALAYSLQVTAKQQELMDKGGADPEKNPKLSYQRVAFGAYLHGALAEESKFNFDDCLRAWTKVSEWEPSFPYARADLERARFGVHSQRGNGAVYVFALVGRGPYKEQVAEVPTQVALLVADRILSQGKYSLPPTIAPVPVPKVVVPANMVEAVRVAVDGTPVGQTGTIADVGRLAKQQADAVYSQVVARAVVRRVVKKAAVYAAKDSMDLKQNSPGSFALDIAGILWEATETADVRCWSLLPEKIQVVRLELPAGDHRLSLAALSKSGITAGSHDVDVHVDDGRNTYVLANFPDTKLVGKILTSRRAAPDASLAGLRPHFQAPAPTIGPPPPPRPDLPEAVPAVPVPEVSRRP